MVGPKQTDGLLGQYQLRFYTQIDDGILFLYIPHSLIPSHHAIKSWELRIKRLLYPDPTNTKAGGMKCMKPDDPGVGSYSPDIGSPRGRVAPLLLDLTWLPPGVPYHPAAASIPFLETVAIGLNIGIIPE